MKLFRRTDTSQQVPAELQPYYDEPTWKVWVRRAVYIIMALLVLFVIVWAGWAVYKSVTDDGSEKPKTPIAQNDNKNNNKGSENKSSSGTENNGKSGSETQNGSSGQSLPSGQSSTDESGKETTTPSTSAMPKTGPADTLAIVSTAVVLSALGHYLYTNRRIRS